MKTAGYVYAEHHHRWRGRCGACHPLDGLTHGLGQGLPRPDAQQRVHHEQAVLLQLGRAPGVGPGQGPGRARQDHHTGLQGRRPRRLRIRRHSRHHFPHADGAALSLQPTGGDPSIAAVMAGAGDDQHRTAWGHDGHGQAGHRAAGSLHQCHVRERGHAPRLDPARALHAVKGPAALMGTGCCGQRVDRGGEQACYTPWVYPQSGEQIANAATRGVPERDAVR